MAGSGPGSEHGAQTVRALLHALPGEFALEVVKAAAPYDEDGSQVALFFDAAASLRRKSHQEAKDAAN